VTHDSLRWPFLQQRIRTFAASRAALPRVDSASFDGLRPALHSVSLDMAPQNTGKSGRSTRWRTIGDLIAGPLIDWRQVSDVTFRRLSHAEKERPGRVGREEMTVRTGS
jgi:hypothetical protein